MNRTSIFRFLTLMVLSICLTQPVMARGAERNADAPVSLTIQQAGHMPNGSLFNPTLQLEVKAPAPLPADEAVLMLRVYRQSEQAPLSKQDIYLTGAAEGINRALHAPSATWADQVTLSPLAGGTRHYYTFSLVTNRKEYFSNTVTGDIPALPEAQTKAEGEIRTLPVVFHLFNHPSLPQIRFDAETVREWIAAANAVLGNAAATAGLTDTRVRLEAARQAPDGTKLTEAGIHRSSDAPVICFDGRADALNLEHPDLYWNPDAYLNVVIVPFALTASNFLGQYPQFPEGCQLSGCHTVNQPTLPHVVYINSLVEPIHGISFFLTVLGSYLGLTEEQSSGVYGLDPSRNTHLGCTPQQVERIEYTLKHAWNTAGSTK
ncbi:hypothetical protein [Bacteroides sp. 14(A)]|uniref:hypothetical protein n=2 Tax=Bacteroidales TaxID=171549 RepID=UPI000471352E|nr:hypothetical protein [Bacteroides sp. 14(A)]